MVRMGMAWGIADSVAGLGGGGVGGGGTLVRAVALVECPARVVPVEEVVDRLGERGARLEVTGLELGADVRRERRPGDDVVLAGGRVLRLEVERGARAAAGPGGHEAVWPDARMDPGLCLLMSLC